MYCTTLVQYTVQCTVQYVKSIRVLQQSMFFTPMKELSPSWWDSWWETCAVLSSNIWKSTHPGTGPQHLTGLDATSPFPSSRIWRWWPSPRCELLRPTRMWQRAGPTGGSCDSSSRIARRWEKCSEIHTITWAVWYRWWGWVGVGGGGWGCGGAGPWSKRCQISLSSLNNTNRFDLHTDLKICCGDDNDENIFLPDIVNHRYYDINEFTFIYKQKDCIFITV